MSASSQIRITDTPALLSLRLFRSSRLEFASIFMRQYSEIRRAFELRAQCQNLPSTKTARGRAPSRLMKKSTPTR